MSVAPNAGVVALDNFKSPTAGEDGIQGQVPKPLAGQLDYVLTANGWVPNTATSGTVTSVDASGGATGMSFSGGPVTTSGILTLGGTLGVASGGTGAGVASSARANLSAAASGANTDITSVVLTTGTISTLPSASNDIVNKSYADSIATGINFHSACQYGTTAALPANTYNNGSSGVGATLTAAAVGTLTIDGYTFVVGDVGKRILVKNEVAGANNGVYTLTQAGTALLPYILTRATDYDTSGSGTNEVDQGDLLLVIYGTVNSNTSWVQQTPLPITIGTTSIVFVQFAAVQTYTAGTGLSLTTNQFSITNIGTAGTYGSASVVPVLTTNAQGQVTGVTNTTISIPSGQVSGLGTMSTQNANAVAITGGTIDGTTVGGTTAAAGTFTTLTATGQTLLGGASGAQTVQVNTTTNTGQYTLFTRNNASNEQQIQAVGAAGANISVSSAGVGSVIFKTNTNTQQFAIANTTSAVNYHNFTGSATGNAPVYSVAGSDAAVSLAIQSKSTGAIDLAAGSSGINISNGGTVTALTRTLNGTGYTSFPSIVISAPTTAGGVQATASNTYMQNLAATIQSGGTGYTVGDVLTMVGGTPQSAAGTFTVATVSSGVVTSVTNSSFQNYSVLPSNPISVTGGTGTGCTLNVTYIISGVFNITNAGSGYVEQPTVTFSGGGGSGASAYATVGSGTTIKSVGSTMSFTTPAGEQFRVIDNANPTVYWQAFGSAGNAILRSTAAGLLQSSGANQIAFQTNQGSTQFNIAHTTSAVNYVQVTGGATGNRPAISTQGSDGAIGLSLDIKSGANFIFRSFTGVNTQLKINGANAAVNNLVITGTTTGNAPSLSVEGTDTNISMVLQSKNTGAIDLSTGSSGVNISNGGTVTALNRTAVGASYTSNPTLAISAPTTAGGVQATATCTVMQGTITIAGGGTGYTAGDVLTFVGGTGSATTITVSTVSSGVITAVANNQFGAYSVVPSNPISVTGGTGTGATFNSNWVLQNSFTITAAGSGYVEQPTVTFSGGGGSGAAAYATVGAEPTIKSLFGGTTLVGLAVATSGGTQVKFVDAGDGSRPIHLFGGGGGLAGGIYQPLTTGLSYSTNAGTHAFYTGGRLSTSQMQITHTTSAVNYHNFTGSATTFAPIYSVAGSDANISMVMQPKGTGAIDLAAGSSGVNISNGGTVTAVTITGTGSFTSFPTPVITAPTTAGGVQAVVAITALYFKTIAIQSGGTGYTAGDVLTIVGGTPTGATATATVSTVSSGVITGIAVTIGSNYSVLPSNPVSVTGGTGTGATFNLSWGIATTSITTAGSGYVEQPSVSFSGGGGSGGAAAYASVGSNPTIKSLTNTLNFATPAGTMFSVIGTSNADSYGYLAGGVGSAGFGVTSSAGNASVTFTSKGTSGVTFYTNNYGSTALNITHTASAVNYVQVTGAATGAGVLISSQGSDASVNLGLQAKSGGVIRFFTGNGTENFRVASVSSTVNYISASGSIAGASPSFASTGTDTDIQLSLVPKGLGIVLLNQQTPAAVTATGTLTIANLLTQIITSTSSTAVSLTLPTGTLSDAGVSGGTSAVNTSFDYSIINTGSAVGDVTLVAGTGHTIVGSVSVPVGTTGRFRCRKTATNTFVSYRV